MSHLAAGILVSIGTQPDQSKRNDTTRAVDWLSRRAAVFRTALLRTAITMLVAFVWAHGVDVRAEQPTRESVAASTSRGAEARIVFQDAIAVWHLRDLHDQSGSDSALSIEGHVALDQPLADESERLASLDCGGDGRVARLVHGWLNAQSGANHELDLVGDQATWLIRFRAPDPECWGTRGLFTQGGGHDDLVFNFFSHDFDQGHELMRVGFELGIAGQSGLGGQVMTHLARIGFLDWHVLIARYDGEQLRLYVDGVNLDQRAVRGPLRSQAHREPTAIGAGTFQGQSDTPFRCEVDHAAIWSRALSDAEIVALSGGPERVAAKHAQFANYTLPQPQAATWELITASRKLKDQFQRDHHRPRYHLLVPEEGDIMPGDPNGAIWWKGRYHLFYIFQRFQSVEPRIVHCWGHVSSLDMVHWERHPTALDVAADDPDQGIFSGNAFVNNEGLPTILYHGVSLGNSIAVSRDDNLIQWEKSPRNPLVPIPRPGDAGHGVYESWDPHGWREGNEYLAIFGGVRPALFRGPTLHELKYAGPFLEHDPWSQPGEDISCPDFFPMGDEHVLLCISHLRGARYFIGPWRDGRFTPRAHARMNWPGGGYFAPETLQDDAGRRVLWAWCMDERPADMRARSGWSGVMSLPRVLEPGADGLLKITPVPELERLRHRRRVRENLVVTADQPLELNDIAGDQLELELEFDPGQAEQLGLEVYASPENAAEQSTPTAAAASTTGREQTLILVDRLREELQIDVSQSTLDPRIRYRSWCIHRPTDPVDANRAVAIQAAPFQLSPGEPLRLRVFLDHSLLEVYANERQAVTQRVWRTRRDATRIRLVSRGGDCRLRRLQAWDMAASQPD